jgi:hypothetical protein
MSILPLLLRIVLTVVLVTPGAGGCAIAAATADPATSTVATDLPPCHTAHATAADAAGTPPATQPAADDPGSDVCGDGHCDCGCPCRALTALASIPADPSATLPESPSSATRPAPRSGTPPPPPTPPPIG